MVSPCIILVICFSYTTHSEPHALYYCTHCIWGYTVHTVYGGTLYTLYMKALRYMKGLDYNIYTLHTSDDGLL